MAHEAQIYGEDKRRAFILAGSAKFTLVSKRTGSRFTYRVVGKDLNTTGAVHFVSVLSGPDNQADYRYLGLIDTWGQFRHTTASANLRQATSFKAFYWLWYHLSTDQIEFWHAGECGRCGRDLTDPESIQRGLGPICAEKGF